MTEQEMFEESFQRPNNYFELTSQNQWEIDKELGIVDWKGNVLEEDKIRFLSHYNIIINSEKIIK